MTLEEIPAEPLLPRAFIESSPFAFCGRELELEQLQRVYDDMRSGDHRLVLVGGEAGIGKTRLAFDHARELADLPAESLAAASVLVPYLATEPVQALRPTGSPDRRRARDASARPEL